MTEDRGRAHTVKFSIHPQPGSNSPPDQPPVHHNLYDGSGNYVATLFFFWGDQQFHKSKITPCRITISIKKEYYGAMPN